MEKPEVVIPLNVLEKFLLSYREKDGSVQENDAGVKYRCETCNAELADEAAKEKHDCKALVGDEIMVRGLLAQVLLFDEATDEFLLFYPKDHNYEGIHFGNAKVTWERVGDTPRKKDRPLKKDFRDPKQWGRFDIQYKDVDYVYTFRDKAMFMVRPSTVAGAGKGLFAARRIRSGDIVGYYEGNTIERMEEGREDGAYVMKLDNQLVDGFGAFNGLQFVNDARGTTKRNNMKITRNGGFKCPKGVPPGRELLVSYGEAFWTHRQKILMSAEKKRPGKGEVQTKNNCGLWAVLHALHYMYPRHDYPEHERPTRVPSGQWFARMRAHVILALMGKPMAAAFVEVRGSFCFIDGIMVGPNVSGDNNIGKDLSILKKVHREWSFEEVMPRPIGSVVVDTKALESLRGSNLTNDNALRGYLSLCLGVVPSRECLLVDSLVFQEYGDVYANKAELQQCFAEWQGSASVRKASRSGRYRQPIFRSGR